MASSNSQHFTKIAHNKIAQGGERWMLAMPTAEGVAPNIPIHGPAQLIASAKQGHHKDTNYSNASFLQLIEGKARQTHQHLIRSLGPCSLLVYGEMDGNHSDWQSMGQHAGELVGATSSGKACNSFSVHAANNSQHTLVASGMGWVAVRSQGIMALFVHVPNDVAKERGKTLRFYSDIRTQVLQATGGGVIDLIMGDTNQPRSGYTQEIVTQAMGIQFSELHKDKLIQPEDAYQRSFGGTNSTGTQKYDIALHNTETVKVENMVYLSQCTEIIGTSGSEAAAITDHMGIGVKVVKV
ncbi:hypothetical protein M0G74_04405 [Microbulbifer sp. CAU 1566]|uniref:hypothetical protein n=1 Tax=Microbulbifer sp. CAU 1566 TaxID=2933269 RepID=UPI002004A918|nr:hypothetical protein [Microbulbifer sp. CAU 1566]MCK7596512.1 hypothetical protein [Microbulbifer sp. CAU 1566]